MAINAIAGVSHMNPNFAGALSTLQPLRQINAREDAAQEMQAALGLLEETAAPTFSDMLKQLIDTANETAVVARQDNTNLSLGLVDDGQLHTIMINAERADLAFRAFVSVRNSLLDAYQEVMRINI